MTDMLEPLEQAVLRLAELLDGIAWRVATEEERKAGVKILEEIREILDQ